MKHLMCKSFAGIVESAFVRRQLREEQHVVAAQEDRLDREEVARDYARGLSLEELAPKEKTMPPILPNPRPDKTRHK